MTITEELRENYKKRERRRKMKKFTIAMFPVGLIVLVLIILAISAVPKSSCFDNQQNGDEEGIDCGGSSCISCEKKYVKPLKAIFTQVLSETKDLSGAIAKIENKNIGQGAKFKYRIYAKDALGQNLASFSGSSFISPSSIKYIVQSKIPFQSAKISKIEVEISDEEWFSTTLSSAKIFSVTEAKLMEIKDTSRSGYLEMKGKLANQSARPFPAVDLVMILYSRTGQILSAVQTRLFDLDAAEVQDFQYTWLNDFPGLGQVDLNRLEVYPDALKD